MTVGPTLQTNAQAKSSLDLNVAMTLGVDYKIDQANFTFPTGGGQGGSFTPADTRMSVIGKTLLIYERFFSSVKGLRTAIRISER